MSSVVFPDIRSWGPVKKARMLFQNQYHRWIIQVIFFRKCHKERCPYAEGVNRDPGYPFGKIYQYSTGECFSHLSCVEHPGVKIFLCKHLCERFLLHR